jgi:H2-forming N5,N10-methylenetetrahydromethanopterin dehydrogenase-like enzyme
MLERTLRIVREEPERFESIMNHLVSKTAFARTAKVSKPAVSLALQGPLGAALVEGRIDPEHPAAVAYLERRAKTPIGVGAPTIPGTRRRVSEAQLERCVDLAEEILARLLRRLAERPHN